MKNIKLGLIAILIITVFASCEDLFKGAVLDVELPEHESRLAPYAFFKDTDSTLTVMVGKSVGILDTLNPDIVYGATVELYKNGVLEYNFTYVNSVRGYQIELSQPFNPVVGDEYELRVSAEGFDDVKATQIVPEKVDITEATIDYNGGVDQFGDPVDIIELKFSDPANVQNYYEINGFFNTVYTDPFDSTNIYDFGSQLDLTSNDPNFSDGTMIDANFDGQEYLLRLQSYNYFGGTDPNYVTTSTLFLNSSTPEYINFISSLNNYWNAQDNPFSEPVLLYSNVSGGLGAFGIMRTVVVEL
jgi:hypothetical protein